MPKPPSRLAFLDACRAFAVLGMLLANMMNVFLHRVPHLLAHNEGDVLSLLRLPRRDVPVPDRVSLVLFLDSGRPAGSRGGARS